MSLSCHCPVLSPFQPQQLTSPSVVFIHLTAYQHTPPSLPSSPPSGSLSYYCAITTTISISTNTAFSQSQYLKQTCSLKDPSNSLCRNKRGEIDGVCVCGGGGEGSKSSLTPTHIYIITFVPTTCYNDKMINTRYHGSGVVSRMCVFFIYMWVTVKVPGVRSDI